MPFFRQTGSHIPCIYDIHMLISYYIILKLSSRSHLVPIRFWNSSDIDSRRNPHASCYYLYYIILPFPVAKMALLGETHFLNVLILWIVFVECWLLKYTFKSYLLKVSSCVFNIFHNFSLLINQPTNIYIVSPSLSPDNSFSLPHLAKKCFRTI